MALYLYLSKIFPEKEIDIFLEKPADIFQCIKNITGINSKYDKSIEYDVFFVLDCEKERLGMAENYFDHAGKTINIDHHISNRQGCGELNYVDPEASSTSELVFDLFEEQYLDRDIAQSVYIGIIHDTGVFQYSNTSPKTLEIAAKLIRYGFDFTKLIEETFYEKTYLQNQILGRALLESFLFLEGKCIVSMIDKKTMEFYHVTSSDLDGIVSQLRETKGVECAVFMYEIETLGYKVSLRSGGKVNVEKIASYFGGGGHIRAAGCTINGTSHDVINNISGLVQKQLEESLD
jgi:phosphoesterase RecJ-like protein